MPTAYWASRGTVLFDTIYYRSLTEFDRFLVVDGGFTNHIFDPFHKVSGGIEVLGFDPSPDAVEYATQLPATFVPEALWSQPQQLPFHQAQSPETSSVYPPNTEFLSTFGPKLRESRATVHKGSVNATTIDSAVEQFGLPVPRFIKLDIHGSEFEALLGAEKSLNSCMGLLVESWHAPVHSGQHLHGDVQALLEARGFVLFDLRIDGGHWHQAFDKTRVTSDRGRLIWSEGLYMRDDAQDRGSAVFRIAVSDLFGYLADAVTLTRRYARNGLLEAHEADGLERQLMDILKERERWAKFKTIAIHAIQATRHLKHRIHVSRS